MAITWSNIEEGDVLSADTLNAKFADVRDGINELKPEYVKERTLSDKHLPSAVLEAKSVRSETVAGHYYGNAYPGYGVDTTSNGLEPDKWAVLGFTGYGFTDQTITFDSAHNLQSDDVRGVLVMANVSIRNIYDASGPEPSRANPTSRIFAHFMVQAEISETGFSWAWRGLWASERYTHADSRNGTDGDTTLASGVVLKNGSTNYYDDGTLSTLDSISGDPEYDVADHMNYSDVPIRFFIDQNNTDILAAEKYIRGVRVVVSTLVANRGTDSTPLHASVDPVVYIGGANLSAMVFQAGGE